MTLKILGSGSSGNCYILQHNKNTLVIDAGIKGNDIIQGLNFDLLSANGVIVTHEHLDHSKAVTELNKKGLKVWQPYIDTENKIQTKTFGCFKVTCFPVPHDNVECRGFIIEIDGEKLLYATDFEYIPFNFKSQNINHMLVECNYVQEIVNSKAENYSHILRGHCNLDTTKEIIRANKTDSLRTVILCHLSSNNSDEKTILDGISNIFNGNTFIAKKGLTVNLDKVPF